MTIFLVGPSRAWKSRLCEQIIPRLPGTTLVDTDAAERQALEPLKTANLPLGGWPERWRRTRGMLDVGGTLPGLPEKAEGKVDITGATEMVFLAQKGGTKIPVPWAAIQDMEYGQRVSRRETRSGNDGCVATAQAEGGSPVLCRAADDLQAHGKFLG